MRFFRSSNWNLFLFFLIGVFLLAGPTSDAIASDDDAAEFVPNRVLVGLHPDYFSIPEDSDSVDFEDGQWDRDLFEFLSRQGTRLISRVFKGFDPIDHAEYDNVPPLDRFFALSFSNDIDVQQICEGLQRLDGVYFAEPDYYLHLPGDEETDIPPNAHSKAFPEDPNDPVWVVHQWNLYDDSVGIRCPVAWGHTTGDPSIRIGFMEDLFKVDHYDLTKIDPLLGKRFYFEVGPSGEGSPAMGDVDLGEIYKNHATKAVGIIAAEANNEMGIAGIAGGISSAGIDGCTIILLQFVGSESFTSSLVGYAIEQASDPSGDLHCDIITMSFSLGVEYSETMRGAIAYANFNRVNVVSGKGNKGNDTANYPADYDEKWMTSVGGFGWDGLYCDGDSYCDGFTSNFGVNMDLLAPAAWYPSTGTLTDPQYNEEFIDHFSSNSSAGPQVAGSLGLLRSFFYDNTLRAEDYENLLKLTSRDPHDGNPQTWNEFYGHGCLDIGTTLNTVDNGTLDQFTALSSSSSAVLPRPVKMKFYHGPYSNKEYDVMPHEVLGSVVFTQYSAPPIAWGNCMDAMPPVKYGFSLGNPNYCTPFNDVVGETVSQSGCNVVTYVYEVFEPNSEVFLGWYPQAPEYTYVACMALEIPTSQKAVQKHHHSESPILVNNKKAGSLGFSVKLDQLTSTYLNEATIFDLKGRVLAVLGGDVNSEYVEFHWDGTTSRGERAASGVYIFSISSSKATLSKKFVLTN